MHTPEAISANSSSMVAEGPPWEEACRTTSCAASMESQRVRSGMSIVAWLMPLMVVTGCGDASDAPGDPTGTTNEVRPITARWVGSVDGLMESVDVILTEILGRVTGSGQVVVQETAYTVGVEGIHSGAEVILRFTSTDNEKWDFTGALNTSDDRINGTWTSMSEEYVLELVRCGPGEPACG